MFVPPCGTYVGVLYNSLMARTRRKTKLAVSPNGGPDTVPASSVLGKEEVAKIVQEMKSKGELPDTRIVDDHEEVAMVRVTPICWGLPFDEVVFAKWVKHMFAHVRMMPWDDLVTSQSTYLAQARNLIHDQYLDESKSEFLFMLDSDVIPPPDILDKLLKHMQHRKDIRMVGGWYRIKDEPYNPVVYHDNGFDEKGEPEHRQYGNNEVGKRLEKVDAAGAGCWMMHRSVAEAIGESPYDAFGSGEDLILCHKVREAGFDLWIDWRLACAHAGVAVA